MGGAAFVLPAVTAINAFVDWSICRFAAGLSASLLAEIEETLGSSAEWLPLVSGEAHERGEFA
jgi:hypothetical protein